MNTSILMCPPDYFGVHYTINPWMDGHIGRVDTGRARRQWSDFHRRVSRMARIDLIEPQQNTPDMVFTANAGLIHQTRFIPSRFKHQERRAEEPHFTDWFQRQGFDISRLPEGIAFEGAGDALFQPESNLLWVGYGFRTDAEALPALEKLVGSTVVPLRLVDPRFYHLDTCLCPLREGAVLYYPPAFDADSRHRIEEKAHQRIEVSEEDAIHFACNAVLVDGTLFMNHASESLQDRLTRKGYAVQVHPVDEFLKAGGANKCLTIALQ